MHQAYVVPRCFSPMLGPAEGRRRFRRATDAEERGAHRTDPPVAGAFGVE